MLEVIGFNLVSGLLQIISGGFSVSVWVSVMWCVMLLDSLCGQVLVVVSRFMVCSFIFIRWCSMVVGRWVCVCSGSVMFLVMVRLVSRLLFCSSIFMFLCIFSSVLLLCGIGLLNRVILLVIGCSLLVSVVSRVDLLLLDGFSMVVMLFLGICSDMLCRIVCLFWLMWMLDNCIRLEVEVDMGIINVFQILKDWVYWLNISRLDGLVLWYGKIFVRLG